MSLPTPELDDRRFQDIVDEAKRRINRLCPEWTDHNVSDPGVALIELFAWMTEMTLYRLNQIPEAREAFDQAKARVEVEFRGIRTGQLPANWPDLLLVWIAHREAETLLSK